MKSDFKLFLPIAAVLLLVAFLRTWHSYGITTKMMTLEISDVGMNPELVQLVEELEQEITERNLYELNMASDPLTLTKILRGSRRLNFDTRENRGALRLSCTVISANRSIAIIKFKGKSYNVGVGDRVNGRLVKSIDNKKVVLVYKGATQVLYNKPAPRGERHHRDSDLKRSTL